MGDESARDETGAPPCADGGGDSSGAGAHDPAATPACAGGIRSLNLRDASHASHLGIEGTVAKHEGGARPRMIACTPEMVARALECDCLLAYHVEFLWSSLEIPQ